MARSLTVAVLVSAAAAFALYAAFHVSPKPIPVAELQLPTPRPVLDRLKSLGAKWKLNRYGQVHWLFLKRLPLSDDDLAILRELPEVKTLSMRGIHTIEGNSLTDAGLRYLTSLKKLEKLDLSANYDLTDASSRWLSKLTNLRWLNISQTDMTEASLPHLSQLRNLREFRTNGFTLNKQTIRYFARMPLTTLSANVPVASYPLLPELKHLSQSPVPWHEDIQDTDIKYFRHIGGIDRLCVKLTNGWSDTSQLRHLRGMRNLEKLTIYVSQDPKGDIDREGIRSLADIPSLRQVVPDQFNNEVLEAFSHCPQIQWLELRSPAKTLTPQGMLSLVKMRNLKAIELPKELVTAEMLKAVSQIRSLEMLSLHHHSRFKANGRPQRQKENYTFPVESLQRFAQLPNLRVLLMDDWNLGEEAMSSIARIESLEALSISNGTMRQRGPIIMDAGLLQLRHLPHLTYLNFYGTQTSMAAAERLHEFLPACYIEDNWCCGCMSIGSPPDWKGSGTYGIEF